MNLSDVAAEQGKQIDFAALEKKLGIPVVLFSAPDRKQYDGFYKALERAVEKKTVLDSAALDSKYSSIDVYSEIKSLIPANVISGYSEIWLAAKAIEGDAPVTAKIKNMRKLILYTHCTDRYFKNILLFA